MATVMNVSGNTYRYLLTTRTGVDAKDMFVAGEVNVQIVSGSWRVGAGATAASNIRTDEVFTVSASLQTSATGSNALALGPLSLQGPSVTLAKTQFKGGKLILTVAIGVDVAKLNFGGSQGGSGITAELTGLLGTFDVSVDVFKALGAITGGKPAEPAPGLQRAGQVRHPGGRPQDRDPQRDEGHRQRHHVQLGPELRSCGEQRRRAQRILVVQQASITFPAFGVTGQMNPNNGSPGLVVYADGFDIGEAQLIYKPGATGPNAMSQTSGGSGKIGIAGILEFDDLRIGVTDFKVTFGQAVSFDGTIFVASGGARFLPGKPVSAIISDRLSSEPDIAPGVPDTEAIRLSLEFEDGVVKGFAFHADTLKITLGAFLSLHATDIVINTSAAADEEMVSFRSVGAEVTIGSLVLGGEGRNFAFLGDGTFVTKPGFGVFISVGGATGDSFKWPTWLPIKITELGISWPDIQNDPTDFVITLSASVTGLPGVSGLKFSGAIEGVKIDVGKLLNGEFPIIDIAAIGVSVEGNLFGGQIKAGLIGGILKLDASGAMIDSFDTTTPVKARIFFIGIEGGFSFSGVGGFGIKFALSELGPLGVYLFASIPGGIILEPNTGLAINDFSAGVEFFKSLPSIDKPEELRGPEFGLPKTVSAADWLAGVKQQVVNQYRAIQANPGTGSFFAAFTSPMLITGGAKVFTAYASQQVFNGEVVLRIATDGKILIIGKLNFAADNLSITGRLYADLSKIASGEATVLFLADIPEQVQLLSIEGRFKMGFRNPNTGEEAFFTVVDPKTGKPYARLAGPVDGGLMGRATLTGRGYIVVDIPLGPSGAALNVASVTDLAAEFKLSGASVTLDSTQAPMLVDGKFWYWVNGDAGASGTLSLIWLKEAWSYTAADGTEVFAPGGAYQDADNQWQGEATSTVAAIPVFMVPYIDIRLVASSSGEIDDATLQSFVAAGVTLFRKDLAGDRAISPLNQAAINAINATATSHDWKTWISMGDGKLRLFFDPSDSDLTAGVYAMTVAASSSWHDSSGAASDEGKTFSFTLVDPQAKVIAPFGDEQPSVDVHVANQIIGSGGHAYVDVVFKATPGASLDYESILDPGLEFDITGLSITNGVPTPVVISVDENGIASYEFLTQPTTDINGDKVVNVADFYALLANQGVTQFRYAATDANYSAVPAGAITMSFKAYGSGGDGWRDSAGNRSIADPEAREFYVEGPTVTLVSPGANGQIDIGALKSRGFIDVTWSVSVAGYDLDPASVTDMAPEFTLSGDGLGTVRLDAGQAPVLLGQTGSNYTYRYWISGEFAANAGATDLVNIEFIAGSWSLLTAAPGTTPAPSVSIVRLTSSQWLTVDFDNVPAGYSIDSASITDLADEFVITYTGLNAGKTAAGNISLVAGVAPQRIGETNFYRFRVTGNFAADSTQTVSLSFTNRAWSFTSETAAVAATQSPDATTLAAASTSYFDIALTPSVQTNTALAQYTINQAPTYDQITLTGNGIVGPPIHPLDLASGADYTSLGNGVYRYYVSSAKFQINSDGAVDLKVSAGAVRDTSTATNRETHQGFSVIGTSANIAGPADGGLIGLASQNNRGFLDITFGFPAGRLPSLDSIYDLDAEFSIDTSTGHSIRLDGTQAPVLIPTTGNTYTFRYFTLGSYASGPVTITLIAGAIGFEDGSVSTSADSMSVANPATANVGYMDVRYQPITGYVLDAESITDPEAEFILSGAGAGVAISTEFAPIRLTGSNTFRYFLSGNFAAGAVTVAFQANTVHSVVADTPNTPDIAGRVGNLASTESFTVVSLTATLADPRSGNSVDVDLLNNRGYFDVDFLDIPLPAGTTGIDIASITDLDPEFTVAIASGTGTIALDDSQAPTRIGTTGYTFRYWYTGSFTAGKLTLTLKAGSFNYLNAAEAATPNAAGDLPELTVVETQNATWIDVRFTTVANVGIDADLLKDDRREISLSGSGIGSAALRDITATIIASSADDIDNNGNGVIDEADETVVRYYVSRSFTAGSVAVKFVGANWADTAGNPGTDGEEGFQVISTLKNEGSQGGQSLGKVFFIEISGGIKLQGLGFTDEPIIDIRGGVTLEIGMFVLPSGGTVALHDRRQRHDQDHQAGQHRFGGGALRAPGRRHGFRSARVLGRGEDPGQPRLPEELRHLRRRQRAAADQHDADGEDRDHLPRGHSGRHDPEEPEPEYRRPVERGARRRRTAVGLDQHSEWPGCGCRQARRTGHECRRRQAGHDQSHRRQGADDHPRPGMEDHHPRRRRFEEAGPGLLPQVRLDRRQGRPAFRGPDLRAARAILLDRDRRVDEDQAGRVVG
jgi:hypothetical protein